MNFPPFSVFSRSHGGHEQQGDRAQGPQAPEHPSGAQRQVSQPSPLRHRPQDRRLRVRPVPPGNTISGTRIVTYYAGLSSFRALKFSFF